MRLIVLFLVAVTSATAMVTYPELDASCYTIKWKEATKKNNWGNCFAMTTDDTYRYITTNSVPDYYFNPYCPLSIGEGYCTDLEIEKDMCAFPNMTCGGPNYAQNGEGSTPYGDVWVPAKATYKIRLVGNPTQADRPQSMYDAAKVDAAKTEMPAAGVAINGIGILGPSDAGDVSIDGAGFQLACGGHVTPPLAGKTAEEVASDQMRRRSNDARRRSHDELSSGNRPPPPMPFGTTTESPRPFETTTEAGRPFGSTTEAGKPFGSTTEAGRPFGSTTESTMHSGSPVPTSGGFSPSPSGGGFSPSPSGGGPGPAGPPLYHYHKSPSCLLPFRNSAKEVSIGGTPYKHAELIGYAIDGFSIYGYQDVGGAAPNVDECGGHFGPVDSDGTGDVVYHYHSRTSVPYHLGCQGPSLGKCKSTQDTSDFCHPGCGYDVCVQPGTSKCKLEEYLNKFDPSWLSKHTVNDYESSKKPQPSGSPMPSGSPKPSGRPSPSGSPKPSGQPSPSGSPKPSGRPSPSGSPKPSGQPSPSGSPMPSGRPSPSGSPKPSGRPSPSGSPKPSGRPSPSDIPMSSTRGPRPRPTRRPRPPTRPRPPFPTWGPWPPRPRRNFRRSASAKDNNAQAERVCKGTCADLKSSCGKLLGCGYKKFNVSRHCPVTCAV